MEIIKNRAEKNIDKITSKLDENYSLINSQINKSQTQQTWRRQHQETSKSNCLYEDKEKNPKISYRENILCKEEQRQGWQIFSSGKHESNKIIEQHLWSTMAENLQSIIPSKNIFKNETEIKTF